MKVIRRYRGDRFLAGRPRDVDAVVAVVADDEERVGLLLGADGGRRVGLGRVLQVGVVVARGALFDMDGAAVDHVGDGRDSRDGEGHVSLVNEMFLDKVGVRRLKEVVDEFESGPFVVLAPLGDVGGL